MTNLGECVFSVVADVVEVGIEILTEATDLHELGVDSLNSDEIEFELACILKIDKRSILVGAVSIGDIIRQMRFVTSPASPWWVIVTHTWSRRNHTALGCQLHGSMQMRPDIAL